MDNAWHDLVGRGPRHLKHFKRVGNGKLDRPRSHSEQKRRARRFHYGRARKGSVGRVCISGATLQRLVHPANGKAMEEDRIDEAVRLGDTEEWTIINTDQQFHNFHIHQTAFLVTEINGTRQNEDSLHDTFPVSPATADRPGTLKVIIPFTDPVIAGKFVYHCHAADHEDKGMMGIIEVTP
jgi:FtsP/CotA-like multicopper oxidase with cupredoxin domain